MAVKSLGDRGSLWGGSSPCGEWNRPLSRFPGLPRDAGETWSGEGGECGDRRKMWG